MKFVKILFVLFIVSVLAVGGVSYWLYNFMHKPHQHDKANQFIVIPKGSSPTETIDKLTSEGILTSSMPTLIYLRTFGDASKLRAGDYQFDSPITPLQVIKELEKGEERTIKVTIPEGFTRFDIAKRLADKFPTNPPTDEKAVLALMDDTSSIKDISPTAKNLEGYLYPSTYNFPIGTKPNDVIKKMVEQFKKIWKPEWTDKAKSLGRTPQDIINIASMIETESKIDDERAIVASVIYNRLNKDIPLGIDQASVYAVKMAGKWDKTINKSDLEYDTPYNTRKYKGLPPGPISNPSESAIEAALNPKQTDYIFYILNVEKNDGSHLFFNNNKDFERAKAVYQAWLKEQREK